jgi:hypothetical protein
MLKSQELFEVTLNFDNPKREKDQSLQSEIKIKDFRVSVSEIHVVNFHSWCLLAASGENQECLWNAAYSLTPGIQRAEQFPKEIPANTFNSRTIRRSC